jgi:hypothetical protein
VPSPQKQKGSGFERDIANQLSTIYKDSFIRTPGSGAYVGGTNNSRKEFLHEGQIRSFKGDIVPPFTWKKFNAECKFYKDFPWHQLYSNCKTLGGWIDQLLDAEDEGDINLLFMKFNRIGTFIAFPETISRHFIIGNHTIYNHHGTNWVISNLGSFLENIQNINSLKEICQS